MVTDDPASPTYLAPATLPLMRLVLAVGVVFVTGAGLLLYVFGEQTDRFFAWSIADPLSAAAIGAFYLTATVVAGLSLVEREWARARVGVPGILVFVWLMLGASLAHLDLFFVDTAPALARLAGVVWMVIYLIDPPLATLAYVRQLRAPGLDRVRPMPMPGWFAGVLLAGAVPVLALGVALFCWPTSAGEAWAWPLTPLVSQALGAWLLGLGLVLVAAARERDWVRVFPASAGLVALALLQLAALLRFDQPTDSVIGWVWVLLLVVLGVVGAVAATARLSPGRVGVGRLGAAWLSAGRGARRS